jgi:transcriptional regulator PpsR
VKRFSVAKKWLGDLDPETASTLITAASDVALVINSGSDGLIRGIAFGSEELEREFHSPEELVGKPWADTVSADSRPKIEAMLRDAAARVEPRWRHVNHLIDGSADLPVMYTAVQVGPRGRIIAVGRSLRTMAQMQQRLIEAQRAMEREYSRLRQAETRHRLLFQVSSEAVLVIDAATRKVVEANPAATQLLAEGGRPLLGRNLSESFDAQGRRLVDAMLARVISVGHADEYPVRAAGEGARDFRVAASLFREGRSAFFLVRLAPGQLDLDAGPGHRRRSRVLDLVEHSPDGFVVTDAEGRIQLANRAFLDAVELATEEQVRNELLDRWLGRPGVDFALLTSQLREHNTLRLFATSLRGEYGASTDVEICAVSVPDGEDTCFGFTIRDVGQRLQGERRAAAERPRSVEQLTELVGRVPLKELVRESTDMIERLCIEAALELTGDNRASAAEILGLSRQSLYAKLRRHGIADIGSESAQSLG